MSSDMVSGKGYSGCLSSPARSNLKASPKAPRAKDKKSAFLDFVGPTARVQSVGFRAGFSHLLDCTECPVEAVLDVGLRLGIWGWSLAFRAP